MSVPPMRKVHLHGHLSTFTDVIELDVATAAEAVRALNANFPGFLKALEHGYYEVVCGNADTGRGMDLEDVENFRLGTADLHFIPVLEGHKRGGFLKILLGVALIGVAVFASGGALGAAIGAQGSMLGGITWGNVALLGLGLAIAGASQMLTPQQKKKDDKTDSYTLSGALNAYEQGNPVPLVYGEVITGGQVISAGVDIEQLKNEV